MFFFIFTEYLFCFQDSCVLHNYKTYINIKTTNTVLIIYLVLVSVCFIIYFIIIY